MLLHLCLAAVPACPAVPELKQRTYFITIYEITLHFVWVLVLHCAIFIFVCYSLLHEDDLHFSIITRHYD